MKTIVYYYDQNGAPIGYQYRGADYAKDQWDIFAFEKNIFGDVVAVYDDNGTKLVTYKYNAWGVCTASRTTDTNTTALNNPFRYRGYYYDVDLGMYYLQSRYYDPAVCRFISPDIADVIFATPMALTDKNLYAYCDNNPVMRVDGDGEFWNYVIGGVVGAVIGGIVAAISGEDVAGIVISAVAGAASGVVAASGLGVIAQAGISAGISSVADISNQLTDILQSDATLVDYNFKQTISEAALGFTTSAIGSGVGILTSKYITKTSSIADSYFDSYLGKSFSAGLRASAGRSSSALLRQAGNFLAKTAFWDNVTRGVSSAIGSVISGTASSLKNLASDFWP